MKGYRTLIFSALMTVVGMLGIKLSPAATEHWGDMYVAAWGIGAILLRQFTNTPVGIAAAQAVEKSAVSAASADGLGSLQAGVAAMLEHVELIEPLGKLLLGMAQKLDTVIAVLTPAPPAAAMVTDGPAPASADGAVAEAPAPTQAPTPSYQPIPTTVVAPSVIAQAAPAIIPVS